LLLLLLLLLQSHLRTNTMIPRTNHMWFF